MQTVRDLAGLRDAVAAFRAEGATIALVPTMGALHAGHMALIEAARRPGTKVIASIFVNPKQFGPNEDLARYPRREAADARLLADHGCDLLWAPPVEVMYPEGFATNVSVTGVSDGLDGAARPGHFDGVATVVTKLFNQTRADIAYFGEKDFQQLAVIRRFVVDLDMAIEIVGVPTQRDDDGLALSSRNIYLDEEQRAKAIALPRALGVAARGIARGDDPEGALAEARGALVAAGFEVDYVALADAETLAESPAADRPRRLLAAARMGTTRLIDNVAVEATP
ncbi:pantoate--beta-alanine ligase [Sphingomonas melonis TY]|uniref:Pantothenate synthetase n=1 Tax=Sphingomonas melonis TY TaxID=621456 RepID=A0A175XZM6_9SPHN|nr:MULTISPECIES: pantoate--beta-alanine ligase [Sphingomonas]MBI0529811.1 pantoate--beta-alanine ligase [Sphingomonas sp. TX0522]AOW22904.1 pantoate--beta-alanine ligase [Sphingomonas melonis TY]ATI56308.1 pantoate--beta-alanine ligase [Sphingomonas melonis]KZB93689.1 pantoate--beta-alanine ligase [Sphingomonas melonis TY]MBX8845952.1 pantoate--beta-alanine ligase [Sphingomonas melonis]